MEMLPYSTVSLVLDGNDPAFVTEAKKEYIMSKKRLGYASSVGSIVL